MTVAVEAFSMQRLKRRALSLGMVKAFDNAMQFLLPLVLVRCLDEATFGEYRLVGLILGTVMTLAPLNMDSGLYFFLPRADPATRRIYIQQTLIFLAVMGLISAIAASPWSPFASDMLAPLAHHGPLVPALVALWVIGHMLDVLPTIDERIRWQAVASLSLGVLRFAVVAVGAWISQDIVVIVWLLFGVAVLKTCMLAAYIHHHHGLGGRWFDRKLFSDQSRHILPLGVASALFGLRAQADQWVAAALFAISSFSAFSIAAVISPVVNIFRQSVMESFLPSMSRLQASGDVRGMLSLNARGNLMVGTLLLPLLAFVFAFAEQIITVLYTPAYLEAAPVMRVYLIGLALAVVEVHSVVLILRQGVFAIAVNCAMLVVSVLASWIFANQLGLAGAAAGSVAAFWIDRALTLRRISRSAGVPFAKVQNWSGLVQALVFAVLVAGLARGLVRMGFATSPALLQLIIGGAVLAAGYGLLLKIETLRQNLH